MMALRGGELNRSMMGPFVVISYRNGEPQFIGVPRVLKGRREPKFCKCIYFATTNISLSQISAETALRKKDDDQNAANNIISIDFIAFSFVIHVV